jgi:hypothetical protein
MLKFFSKFKTNIIKIKFDIILSLIKLMVKTFLKTLFIFFKKILLYSIKKAQLISKLILRERSIKKSIDSFYTPKLSAKQIYFTNKIASNSWKKHLNRKQNHSSKKTNYKKIINKINIYQKLFTKKFTYQKDISENFPTIQNEITLYNMNAYYIFYKKYKTIKRNRIKNQKLPKINIFDIFFDFLQLTVELIFASLCFILFFTAMSIDLLINRIFANETLYNISNINIDLDPFSTISNHSQHQNLH